MAVAFCASDQAVQGPIRDRLAISEAVRAPRGPARTLLRALSSPRNSLGGETRLDRTAAERAVDAIANRLGADRITAARGIHQIANTQMAEGIRLVSVRRGVDPRRFTLLAFGGAAGLHITDVARQLEI